MKHTMTFRGLWSIEQEPCILVIAIVSDAAVRCCCSDGFWGHFLSLRHTVYPLRPFLEGLVSELDLQWCQSRAHKLRYIIQRSRKVFQQLNFIVPVLLLIEHYCVSNLTN